MKQFQSASEIKVSLDFGDGIIPVGRLAILDQTIYFEYYSSFINKGIEISPFRLPLKTGLSTFDYDLFEGLPGVFNDSLPDGWGHLLVDRFVRSSGFSPESLTPLDRLSFVGNQGMGALVYEPDRHGETTKAVFLDRLAEQAQEILHGSTEDGLRDLRALSGSSAGARPKIIIGIDAKRKKYVSSTRELPKNYDHWLVKFPNTQDGIDAGAIEYVYACMAKQAGISMPDVHLFPAANGPGYFSVKLFDRKRSQRFHLHTASGLLHADFRSFSLDYKSLIMLTLLLTKEVGEAEKMYRLAVFNVLSHNRDDHSKNFSFLMDKTGNWKLAPAYDLTHCAGPRGQHSTTVMGEGQNPGIRHLQELGHVATLPQSQIDEIIASTTAALANWVPLAKKHGVHPGNIKLINQKLPN